MKSRQGVLAIVLATSTMLSAVGLVATGGWLISSAALMPPILTLQVAIVSVRFFGIARGSARWGERVMSHEVALTGTTQARVRLWLAASVLGPRGIWRLRGSDALDRLTADTETLQDDVTRVRTPFIAAAVSAVLLVVIQYLNLPAAGVALAAAFVVAGVLSPLMTVRVDARIAHAALGARNELSTHISTVIAHADDLRLTGAAPAVLEAIARADAQRVQVESAASRWAGLTSSLNNGAAGLAVFSSLIAAVESYSRNALSGPMIAVIVLLPWASAEIMTTFSQAVTARSRVVVARERVHQLLSSAQRVSADRPTPTVSLSNPRTLTVDDLQVAWDDSDVVSGLSFEVACGEQVALVGPSGSGKSTVAAAMLRLVEHRGTIALEGVPIEHVVDYRTHVTAMLQTTHIFSTTVRENLRVANATATDEQMLNALEAAGLCDWLSTLSAGLDTGIGAGQRGMSGGEIQRLGLARVLLTSAEFVVLDEPTEHLDAETAQGVWHTINQSLSHRGVLMITHDAQVRAARRVVL